MPFIICFPNDPRYKGMDHYYRDDADLTTDWKAATTYETSLEAQAKADTLGEIKGLLKPTVVFVGRTAVLTNVCPHCGQEIKK